MGCDSLILAACKLFRLFQSTHPHGVRRRSFSSRRAVSDFNPRTRMGCDATPRACARCWAYFNPRTRMGCDQLRQLGHLRKRISIHAPAWGATAVRRDRRVRPGISIHAPAWGATRRTRRRCARQGHFNPRTRMGCDDGEDISKVGNTISIHAPAWGATLLPSYGFQN